MLGGRIGWVVVKIFVTGIVLLLVSIPLIVRDHQRGGGDPDEVQSAQHTHGAALFKATYIPGDLTISENGLRLSTGLKSRLIAESEERVPYKDGNGRSSEPFHSKPDGAAVVEHPSGIGWVYVSNSESADGGVGALTFDEHGDVVKYRMVLTGTRRNCQGGLTPWKSWISCEEDQDDGQCWETDPFGKRNARKTQLGGDGGNYEAVACDYRDKYSPLFFVTNDKRDGEIRRFRPNPDVVFEALHGGDFWDILSKSGTTDYLVLSSAEGTFRWSPDLEEGKESAARHFQNCEGMDIMDGKLYFVSAKQRELFELDLDRGEYKKTSTYTEELEGAPDGLLRNRDMLYIAEETKNDKMAGLFGRDLRGNFFTILESRKWRGDVTGVAFSPDKTRLYIAYQKAGKLFEITRKDGRSFEERTLEIRYHSKS